MTCMNHCRIPHGFTGGGGDGGVGGVSGPPDLVFFISDSLLLDTKNTCVTRLLGGKLCCVGDAQVVMKTIKRVS